ncbi:metallophosphoesterase family protein [Seleniivibrio sp.]|uniref:metallophosphoesterase family protein n=1 Tax=Seleniivibrio sp. TaxID=2898801 RepID=UPI0025F1DE8D|nr:metallophosphoesterase family protein [Seleniivibrio sp.]MCD8553156.1 metallophosphatase family protein [Seleniivibrio sp.]
MILAVFSDIHGNVHSLERALKLMEAYRPHMYVFLGDMAGYYYFQNECVTLLNGLDGLVSVKGNHDDNFLKNIDKPDVLNAFGERYGTSYSLLAENITDECLSFMKNMRESVIRADFEAFHGSPRGIDEYIYKETDIDFNVSVPYLFTGHTHHPLVRAGDGFTLINPGSVGQPRDHNKGSFAVVDTTAKKHEHVRYEYDRAPLFSMIEKLNDHKYLAEVLMREEKNV